MFDLIKSIVWIVGLVAATYFALPYFGYEFNLKYFNESKSRCQENLNKCTKDLIQQGTQNAKCDFNCVNPQLIIKKK